MLTAKPLDYGSPGTVRCWYALDELHRLNCCIRAEAEKLAVLAGAVR